MKSKLKSRKFWMAVATAVLVILNQGLGLDLPSESIKQIVIVILGYILTEGAKDVAVAVKNGKKED